MATDKLIGEPIWAGRSATEYPACAQHEALINAAFTGRPATILCPYNARALDPEWVEDTYRTHPVVVDATTLRIQDTQLGTGAHVNCIGKGRKQRITPLTKDTVTTLKNWIKDRGGLPADPLFPTRSGTAITL